MKQDINSRIYRKIQVPSALLLISVAVSAQNWQTLFNGKNLDGWEINGGSAKYEVVDGAIVGIASIKSDQNTFLCTKKTYSDFILEVDVLLPNDLNSGIQFRSKVNEYVS